MKNNWKLVSLLSATATAGYICRVNVSTAGAAMMNELHLSQVDMGRIFSSFLLGYAIFQIPSGIWADRWGSKRVLQTITWLWVGLTALQAVWGWKVELLSSVGFLTTFLITRFALGVTASATYPSSARGVAQWMPASMQARANGLVIASVGLGSALAPPLVSVVMVRWGWQWSILATSVPALLMAILWRFVSPPTDIADTPAAVHTDPMKSSPTLANRPFVLLTLSYSLQGYVGYIFVSWFYLYLVQERGFSMLTGAWMSSLPWVLSIVSIPLGGWLSDRLILTIGGRWSERLVPMIGMGGSGILIAIGAHTSSAIVAALTLALATALVLCVEGPFWGAMTRMAGARSGLAGGMMNTGSNVGGLISPVLTPWMATFIGWENALLVAGALAVIAALLWLGIDLPNDQH